VTQLSSVSPCRFAVHIYRSVFPHLAKWIIVFFSSILYTTHSTHLSSLLCSALQLCYLSITHLLSTVATHFCSVPRTLHWLQHRASNAWVKRKGLNKPSGAGLSGAGGKLHREPARCSLMSNLLLDTKRVPEDR